ncbi:hypothetical protein FRC01_013313 [Tulasnella sp. 417]|nr:hypothetical protein FRC01_013313 [Tulasnella sp. 417]
MSSNHNFESANDIEKGHGVSLSIDTSMSVGSPIQHASNDPLSPTFGATLSPAVSPLALPTGAIPELPMQNISSLNLGNANGAATPSMHALTSSAAIPPMSLDSSPATAVPAATPSSDLPAPPKPALIHNEYSTAATLPVLPLSKTVSEEKLKLEEKKEQSFPAVEKNAGDVQHIEVQKPAAPAPAPIVVTKWVKFQLWYNTYRKFFTVVVTFNFISIVLTCLGRFPYAQKNVGGFILGNLCTAVLMRNELFGRLLYLIANTLLAKACQNLVSTLFLPANSPYFSGLHCCALSGTAWLIYHVVWLCAHASVQHRAVIATGIVTNLAIIISVLSAFPWVRNNRHNLFERHHRFVGWTGLIFTWIFVMLGNGYDEENGVWDWQGRQIVKTQDIYFVICMTILIALPWIFTRKVKVDVEIPSPKVAILRFERGMQQGLLGRISRTSILEYHAFGTISEGKHAKYHYMVCGVQGDFTRGLVENPPTHIWTREIKFAGISNTSPLYRRGIRIATGTGIGAALSTCLQSKGWFLIWIGSDQEKTFGKTISGLIESGIEPERRILWDSKKLKRPNTMKLLKETYDAWGAEVVFITSNYGGNKEMMEGCKTLGIPAFGTLWDF